jgi:hypothetical protein
MRSPASDARDWRKDEFRDGYARSDLMRAERLLRLYPRAWRERYGEEFLAVCPRGPLRAQHVIDIFAGAIDAWLSPDVRRATPEPSSSSIKAGATMLHSLRVCEANQVRYTKRDGMIGAAVMLGVTLLLVIVGGAARRAGWPETGEVLVELSFMVAFLISTPFWLMKGQPWKAQAAIVGGALAILATIAYFS